MRILAIEPDQFDPAIHRLPTAGELLLPGVQVYIQSGGVAFALKQALMEGAAVGVVIELCRQGDRVEVALSGAQQQDGGFFFERLWVLVE